MFRLGSAATWLPLALHAGLGILLAALLNGWVDEYWSLRTTGAGFDEVIAGAVRFEHQPPGYFLTLWLWRSLDDSLFWSRVLSVVFSTAAIALIGRSIAKLAGGAGRAPALLMLALAIHPFTLYVASEARVYAMAMFLAALLLHSWLEGFAAGTSRRWAIIHVLAAITALYTFYYSGFTLLTLGVGLLCLDRRAVLRYGIAMAIAGVAFAPAIEMVRTNYAGHAQDFGGDVSLTDAITYTLRVVLSHLVPTLPDYSWSTSRAIGAATLALWAVGSAVAWFRTAPGRRRLAAAAVAALAASILAFSSVTWGAHRNLVLARHTSVLVPLLWLVVGYTLAVGVGPRVRAAACVIVLALCAVCTFSGFRHGAKHGDWDRVTQYVEAHEGASQPIIVFSAEIHHIFGEHYRGACPVYGFPGDEDPEIWDPRTYALQSPAEMSAFARSKVDPSANQRFWLIENHLPAYLGVEFGREHIREFIDEECRVLRERHFVGTTAWLLELKRP